MTKQQIQRVFSRVRLEDVLYGLWLHRDAYQKRLFEVACTTSIAIECCVPGPNNSAELKNLDENSIGQLVKAATSFCLGSGTAGLRLNEGNRVILYLLQQMANQGSFFHDDPGEFARALILFEAIPCEHKASLGAISFDLPTLFQKKTGYSVRAYLQTCFISFSAFMAHGKLTDEYLVEVERQTEAPTYQVMNQILGDISFSARFYNQKRVCLNGADKYDYHPLLISPLVKPWSNVSQVTFGKRYLAPIPSLIIGKARSGIYHRLLTECGTEFTGFYGKNIFEPYVSRALKRSLSCYEQVKEEAEFKNDLNVLSGMDVPDFLVLGEQVGIVVECKAARFPRDVLTKGNLESFRTTFEKLEKAVKQVAEFSGFTADKKAYGITSWSGLIITDEPLTGMSGQGIVDVLAGEFVTKMTKEEFIQQLQKIQILSIGELDMLLVHVSEKIPLDLILKRLQTQPFNEVVSMLREETGRCFEHSHLFPVFEELLEPLVCARPEE